MNYNIELKNNYCLGKVLISYNISVPVIFKSSPQSRISMYSITRAYFLGCLITFKDTLE